MINKQPIRLQLIYPINFKLFSRRYKKVEYKKYMQNVNRRRLQQFLRQNNMLEGIIKIQKMDGQQFQKQTKLIQRQLLNRKIPRMQIIIQNMIDAQNQGNHQQELKLESQLQHMDFDQKEELDNKILYYTFNFNPYSDQTHTNNYIVGNFLMLEYAAFTSYFIKKYYRRFKITAFSDLNITQNTLESLVQFNKILERYQTKQQKQFLGKIKQLVSHLITSIYYYITIQINNIEQKQEIMENIQGLKQETDKQFQYIKNNYSISLKKQQFQKWAKISQIYQNFISQIRAICPDWSQCHQNQKRIHKQKNFRTNLDNECIKYLKDYKFNEYKNLCTEFANISRRLFVQNNRRQISQWYSRRLNIRHFNLISKNGERNIQYRKQKLPVFGMGRLSFTYFNQNQNTNKYVLLSPFTFDQNSILAQVQSNFNQIRMDQHYFHVTKQILRKANKQIVKYNGNEGRNENNEEIYEKFQSAQKIILDIFTNEQIQDQAHHNQHNGRSCREQIEMALRYQNIWNNNQIHQQCKMISANYFQLRTNQSLHIRLGYNNPSKSQQIRQKHYTYQQFHQIEHMVEIVQINQKNSKTMIQQGLQQQKIPNIIHFYQPSNIFIGLVHADLHINRTESVEQQMQHIPHALVQSIQAYVSTRQHLRGQINLNQNRQFLQTMRQQLNAIDTVYIPDQTDMHLL